MLEMFHSLVDFTIKWNDLFGHIQNMNQYD